MIYSITFNDGSTYLGRSTLPLDTVIESHKRNPVNAIVSLRLLSGDDYEIKTIDGDLPTLLQSLDKPLNARCANALPEIAFRDAARKLCRFGHLRVWRLKRIFVDGIDDEDWIAAHE